MNNIAFTGSGSDVERTEGAKKHTGPRLIVHWLTISLLSNEALPYLSYPTTHALFPLTHTSFLPCTPV